MFTIAAGIMLACAWILMAPTVWALTLVLGWALLRVAGIIISTLLVFWLLHKLGSYPAIALSLLAGAVGFVVWDQRQFKAP